MPRDEYRRGILCGNGNHRSNGTRLEKLEEMQSSIVRRRMHAKLIRPVMLWGRNVATTKKQDHGINVNEMTMIRWMYELTRTICNEHLGGTTRVAQASIRSLKECRTDKGM